MRSVRVVYIDGMPEAGVPDNCQLTIELRTNGIFHSFLSEHPELWAKLTQATTQAAAEVVAEFLTERFSPIPGDPRPN